MNISLAAEAIFHIGSFSVTNALLTSLVGTVLTIVTMWSASRAIKFYPASKLGNFIEWIIDGGLKLIEDVTHDRKQAIRFLPLLMSLFLFILLNNWLGLLPGFGSIKIITRVGAVPLLRGANADLNTTLALAVISVVMTQVYAVRELGLFKHLSKYFSFNPILLFVGLLELVSEFSKMISFSFRLFGNIFAGEVLLAVIAAISPLLAPLPFFGLELFVGLIQALVFAMLSLMFMVVASSTHGDSSGETPKHHQPVRRGIVETTSAQIIS